MAIVSLPSEIMGGDGGSCRRVTEGSCATEFAEAREVFAAEYRLLKFGTLELSAAGEGVRPGCGTYGGRARVAEGAGSVSATS